MYRVDLKVSKVPERWRWGGEVQLTEAQVNALIDARLFGYTYRQMRMDVPITTVMPGIRSAGFVDRPWGLMRDVSLPVGNNKIFEICESEVIEPGDTLDTTMGPTWSQPFKFKMIQNCANLPASPTGEWLQGIEWGSFSTIPPFQTTYASAVPTPCVQLRHNLTRAKWEVLVWDGDTTLAPDVVDCLIQPIFTPDLYLKEFMLEYQPSPTTSVLNAYINGVLALRYTGTRLQNCFGFSTSFKAGYFCTSGDTGIGRMLETGFYTTAIYQPNSLPVPPNRF